MRSTRLLPLLFALIPAACGDDIKFPDQVEVPDPALNGVFPSKGFTDRALRVEISGDGTEFSGTPTVSFGADITVANVELASPSTLFANITIAGAAAVGTRDVVVTNGAEALTLTRAFDVQNPLEIITDGPALQWGRNVMLIINHDPETPFLGNLSVTAGTGVHVQLDSDFQTESIAFGEVFIDDNGASGPVVVSDTLIDTNSSRGAVLEVTPRTPTPMTAQTTGIEFQNDNVTLTNTTAVFSYTANADGRWLTFASKQGGGDALQLSFLPTGKWADAVDVLASDLREQTSGTLNNIVVFDNGATGTLFNILADVNDATDAVALAEEEDNDQFDNGNGQIIPADQDVTLFTGLLNSDDTGFDDIVVTLAANDQIRVTTAATDVKNAPDTVIVIFDETFDNIVAGSGFEDNSFCCGDLTGLAAADDVSADDFTSDVMTAKLPAGTYNIEIADSFFLFGFGQPDDVPYEALITIHHNP